MAKTGRPSKYKTHVEPYLDKIKEMALTMTDEQIAETLGVGYSSFRYYKQQFPALADSLKKGKKDLVMELKSALIKKAKGYEYIETKEIRQRVDWPDEMYALLLDAGFTSEQIEQSMLVKTETSHKYASPDVAAANLLLKNYDKENWANDPQMLEIRKKELKLQEKKIELSEYS